MLLENLIAFRNFFVGGCSVPRNTSDTWWLRSNKGSILPSDCCYTLLNMSWFVGPNAQCTTCTAIVSVGCNDGYPLKGIQFMELWDAKSNSPWCGGTHWILMSSINIRIGSTAAIVQEIFGRLWTVGHIFIPVMTRNLRPNEGASACIQPDHVFVYLTPDDATKACHERKSNLKWNCFS